jgi:hypothetical protein
MCYNKRQMCYFSLPNRSSVFRPVNQVLGIAVLLAMLVAIRTTAAEEPTSANEKTSPSSAAIEKLIAQLGSADFRTREEAVRQLTAAGSSAIEPLTKAAHAQDLEVSYRAVRALQSMLEQGDVATQNKAASVLEELSASNNDGAAELAADALSLYHLTQQDRALDSLRRLGAKMVDIGFSDDLQIMLDSEWHGTSADLALLKQVPHLIRLRILYLKIDDAALKTLSELNQVGFIDLYGTGMTDESAAVLAQALPAVTIDRRNGAMLGVKSTQGAGCTINEVVPDSGAMAADLHPGDEILTIDGYPIQQFADLTTIVGAKNAGDTVSIDVKRDGQVLNKQVTLGKWPSIWPN